MPTPNLDPSQPRKLTTWSNEPSLNDLRSDFESAKPAHDAQVTLVDKWNNLARLTGRYTPKKVKGRSSVQPKLVRRQAEWRYAALSEPFLSNDKVFSVKPVTFEDVKAARQNELLLNHQFRTVLNRVKFVDDYVRVNVDEGSCVVQLGWCRETKKAKETVPTFTHFQMQTEEELQVLQQALQAKQENPRGYEEKTPPEIKAAVDHFLSTGEPTVAQQDGTTTVEVDKIVRNHPTMTILNQGNFYPDPSCGGDLEKAKFACVTLETCQADLKASGRYKNLELVDWDNAAPVVNPDHETTTPTDFQFRDPMRKRVVAFEYWGFYDIHGNGELVPIVATWIGMVLIRMELNPFPDGKLPFVITQYLPKKRELFGETDAELLEDNQAILGAVTRGMIDLMGRSANGQQGFAKGMLDPVNKRKFENGQDYEFNPNVNMQQGHIHHTYPEIPQSALMMLNLQNQEAESLTGVKAFSGGMSGEAYGDVAAGIRGVLDASAKREMSILRRLSMGFVQIAQRLIAMNGKFMSEKEVIRVTNEEFVTVARDEVQGTFDCQVDISTAEIDNAQAQDLGFMLQTMGPNLGLPMVQIILAKIATLKRMPDLAKEIERYQPQPDPLEQQLKQAEVQKALKEVEKLQSEIELNQAKARQALTQADQADLDYVEQETGTKHAREMEKQAGQARGNQDLEITKALVAKQKTATGGEKPGDIEAAVGWNEMSSQRDDPRPDPQPLLI